MLPGKPYTLDLAENEKAFLKFSYPHKGSEYELHMSVETDYGDYQISYSRDAEYPNK